MRAGVTQADERRRPRTPGPSPNGRGETAGGRPRTPGLSPRGRGEPGGPLDARDRGAELGPTAVGNRQLARMMAVEDLDGVVVGLIADQRTDDDQLVHHAR